MRTQEIEVQVLGKKFNFNVPNNIEPGDFQAIVSFVEKKIKRLRQESQDLDAFELGLLASINIAEEYFSLKRENEKLRVVLNRIDQLLSPQEEGGQIPINFSS